MKRLKKLKKLNLKCTIQVSKPSSMPTHKAIIVVYIWPSPLKALFIPVMLMFDTFLSVKTDKQKSCCW